MRLWPRPTPASFANEAGMVKKLSNGRSKGDGGYIDLRRWLLRTEAWRDLSPGPDARILS